MKEKCFIELTPGDNLNEGMVSVQLVDMDSASQGNSTWSPLKSGS